MERPPYRRAPRLGRLRYDAAKAGLPQWAIGRSAKSWTPMSTDGSQDSSSEDLTPLEVFHNGYYYFIQAVEILASDPETQCARGSDYNVAGELILDVSAGRHLANSELPILTAAQQVGILTLVSALEGVPVATLPSGTGREANLVAMQHRAWIPLRSQAAELLISLCSATEQNIRYLWPDLAARRALTASDMMQQRHGLPQWALGRSTKR
jgi:hypothetical protein